MAITGEQLRSGVAKRLLQEKVKRVSSAGVAKKEEERRRSRGGSSRGVTASQLSEQQRQQLLQAGIEDIEPVETERVVSRVLAGSGGGVRAPTVDVSVRPEREVFVEGRPTKAQLDIKRADIAAKSKEQAERRGRIQRDIQERKGKERGLTVGQLTEEQRAGIFALGGGTAIADDKTIKAVIGTRDTSIKPTGFGGQVVDTGVRPFELPSEEERVKAGLETRIKPSGTILREGTTGETLSLDIQPGDLPTDLSKLKPDQAKFIPRTETIFEDVIGDTSKKVIIRDRKFVGSAETGGVLSTTREVYTADPDEIVGKEIVSLSVDKLGDYTRLNVFSDAPDEAKSDFFKSNSGEIKAPAGSVYDENSIINLQNQGFTVERSIDGTYTATRDVIKSHFYEIPKGIKEGQVLTAINYDPITSVRERFVKRPSIIGDVTVLRDTDVINVKSPGGLGFTQEFKPTKELIIKGQVIGQPTRPVETDIFGVPITEIRDITTPQQERITRREVIKELGSKGGILGTTESFGRLTPEQVLQRIEPTTTSSIEAGIGTVIRRPETLAGPLGITAGTVLRGRDEPSSGDIFGEEFRTSQFERQKVLTTRGPEESILQSVALYAPLAAGPVAGLAGAGLRAVGVLPKITTQARLLGRTEAIVGEAVTAERPGEFITQIFGEVTRGKEKLLVRATDRGVFKEVGGKSTQINPQDDSYQVISKLLNTNKEDVKVAVSGDVRIEFLKPIGQAKEGELIITENLLRNQGVKTVADFEKVILSGGMYKPGKVFTIGGKNFQSYEGVSGEHYGKTVIPINQGGLGNPSTVIVGIDKLKGFTKYKGEGVKVPEVIHEEVRSLPVSGGIRTVEGPDIVLINLEINPVKGEIDVANPSFYRGIIRTWKVKDVTKSDSKGFVDDTFKAQSGRTATDILRGSTPQERLTKPDVDRINKLVDGGITEFNKDTAGNQQALFKLLDNVAQNPQTSVADANARSVVNSALAGAKSARDKQIVKFILEKADEQFPTRSFSPIQGASSLSAETINELLQTKQNVESVFPVTQPPAPFPSGSKLIKGKDINIGLIDLPDTGGGGSEGTGTGGGGGGGGTVGPPIIKPPPTPVPPPGQQIVTPPQQTQFLFPPQKGIPTIGFGVTEPQKNVPLDANIRVIGQPVGVIGGPSTQVRGPQRGVPFEESIFRQQEVKLTGASTGVLGPEPQIGFGLSRERPIGTPIVGGIQAIGEVGQVRGFGVLRGLAGPPTFVETGPPQKIFNVTQQKKVFTGLDVAITPVQELVRQQTIGTIQTPVTTTRVTTGTIPTTTGFVPSVPFVPILIPPILRGGGGIGPGVEAEPTPTPKVGRKRKEPEVFAVPDILSATISQARFGRATTPKFAKSEVELFKRQFFSEVPTSEILRARGGVRI